MIFERVFLVFFLVVFMGFGLFDSVFLVVFIGFGFAFLVIRSY